MRLKNRRFETFNDGKLDVCEAAGRTLKTTKLPGVHFGNRTVGERRFWDAKVLGSVISKMVCVPYTSEIERDHIVIIEGRQYCIAQTQEKFDASPPCLYLSLESIQPPYRDERGEADGKRNWD